MNIKDLKTEMRLGDMYDGFGNCMSWWFALCDYMEFDISEPTPADWGYRSAMGGADTESYEYQTFQELKPDAGDCLAIGSFLEKYYNLLVAAGKDY